MAKLKSGIGRFGLFRVGLDLLFMQGLLNRRGMQNLALARALGAAAMQDPDHKSFLQRHLSYFNCNPNLVPLIAGGVIRLEEERRAGKPVTVEDIEFFKKSLASPLAAMGDMLFLGALKPLALTLGCLFAIYKFPIGLLAIILLYNVAIIACRFWGIYFGYSKGWELVDSLSGPEFQRVLAVVQGLGAAAGGVLAGVLFSRFPQTGQWALAGGSLMTLVTLYLLKKDIPASWFAIILFPAFVLVSLIVG